MDLLSQPRLKVVDVRWYLADPDQGLREYLEAHVAGSIHLDVEADLSGVGRGRHPLPKPDEFAARLGAVGISNDHTVVAYDSAGGAVAARLWWMMRHLGHEAVAVLDGGWQAWLADGGQIDAEVPHIEPALFAPRPRGGDTIDRETLLARLGGVRLIDARAAERYEGITEPIDAAAGHIPTAVNHPHTDNLDATGRLLSAEKLRSKYGVDASPTVAYCGSGVTACHTILAHAVAGLPEPLLYEGSWSDWASVGLPVDVGPGPRNP